MPAAAVIPASIVYIKVVAVKKLVVGILPRRTGPPIGCASGSAKAPVWQALLRFTVWSVFRDFYFEEIKVFHAGARRVSISME